jgi:uncharacterized protein (TIGR02001 family)
MKKLLLALLLAAGLNVAHAQVTGNLGLASDYRFRGVSQTQNAMAVQGGVDYNHTSGLYIGNWNSSVSTEAYTSGAGVESDVYAGWKKEIARGLTLDVGTLKYFYPRASTSAGASFDTHELYAGLAYGPVSVKYSQSLSDYFGIANSKNSQYLQADVAWPVSKTQVTVLAHAGRTEVNNSSKLSYNDYNVGLAYDLKGWTIAAKYYFNDNKTSTFMTANTINGQQLYKDATVVSVSKSF